MSNQDQLLHAIGAIHAAGLDETLWPQALAAITALCSGAGATLEIFDKALLRHSGFFAHEVPAPSERSYVEYWAARNPRAAYGLRQNAGDITCDYEILDEAAIDRNEFYTDMLAPAGFRYFVSTTPINNKDEFAALAVQRTRRQGHVDAAEVDIMRRLTPHIQQALDVAARLQKSDRTVATFEQALDWLDDGIAQLRDDGRIVSCNSAFSAMMAGRDGIRIEKGTIVFGTHGDQTQLAKALASLRRHIDGNTDSAALFDFAVVRPSGAPAYVVSLRPLGAPQGRRPMQNASIILFIRDPAAQDTAASQLLREMFGLTPAEASLARALQRGLSPLAYARERALSPNTVYTHLRRIKDKTGWTRTAELNRKLNELVVPARL